MKSNFKGEIPDCFKPLPMLEPVYANIQEQIEEEINGYIKLNRQEFQQKYNNTLRNFDFDRVIVNRRTKALINDVKMLPPEFQKYTSKWVTINIMSESYSILVNNYRIMTAAAIWILDRLYESGSDMKEIYKLLPRDRGVLDELYTIDICDTQFDKDLIFCVEYVLRNRNMDIATLEDDGNNGKRVLTSALAAEGKAHGNVPSRNHFEALIGMIPPDSIEAAVSQFKQCFEEYKKKYFMFMSQFTDNCEKIRLKVNELRTEINQERALMLNHYLKAREKYNRGFTKIKKSAAINQILSPKAHQPSTRNEHDLSGLLNSIPASPTSPFELIFDRTEQDVRSEICPIIEKIEKLDKQHEKLRVEYKAAIESNYEVVALMISKGHLDRDLIKKDYGNIKPFVLDSLPFTDPYAMCFALLYLIEQDSDIPWLYGACIDMMYAVANSLPWAHCEFDKQEDEYWFRNTEDNKHEPLAHFSTNAEHRAKPYIQDWYQRDYHRKGDDPREARNLAQILYEKTGCLMPRNLHRYESMIIDLKEYGLRQNKAVAMLYCMIALGTKRRTEKALNLDEGFMMHLETGKVLDEKLSREELQNSNLELQKELQKLRSALHNSEKNVTILREKLAWQKEQSEAEHRELADLREVVFKIDTDLVEETKENSSIEFPYTVKKSTVVFGGHDKWVKMIKPLLKGDIKFVPREMKIDVSLVRYADVVWIQTNAIPHRSFYSIADTARKYHKPIRYFTFASATKCAEQIVENDQ